MISNINVSEQLNNVVLKTMCVIAVISEFVIYHYKVGLEFGNVLS